jgi:hypothetical protein
MSLTVLADLRQNLLTPDKPGAFNEVVFTVLTEECIVYSVLFLLDMLDIADIGLFYVLLD